MKRNTNQQVAEYNFDAFGRKRISGATTVFDNTFQYGLNDLVWFQEASGTGSITHQPDKSAVELEVTTGDGDLRALQSKKYHRYEPGKSQLIMMSFVLGEGEENCEKTVGYGDKENGIFFQQNGEDYSVFIRSKASGTVAENTISQEDWNIDVMDGTGASGIDFDGTKAQLLIIDLEWLSVGRVRVGFARAGKIYYVHEFKHTNIIDSPYMSTANLPIRYEIKNDGTTDTNTSMDAICCTVISEGGQEFANTYPFSISNGTDQIAVGDRQPILSIRPRGTFNSITNRIELLFRQAEVVAQGNDAFVEIVYNGTLSIAEGTVDWNDVDTDNSSVEYNVNADGITGGIVIDTFTAVSGGGQSRSLSRQEITSKLPLVVDIEGNNPTPLSIVVTAYASTADVSGTLTWDEVY